MDQGPIDMCDAEAQASKLQSIHCGLPASWTRARRHPPSSPSPVASRGGGRALAFLNWTRVQLDLSPARREASSMGVHAQKADGSSNTESMVRIPGGTFRMGSDKHRPEEAHQDLPPGSEGRLAPARANYRRHYRAPRAASRYLSHHVGFQCIIRGESVMKRIAILLSVGLLVGLGLLIAFAPTPRAGAQISVVAISEADAGAK